MNRKGTLARILSILFILVLMVTLVACNDSSSQGSDKEYILVGRVVPLTGFLATFGAGSPDVEQLAVDAINAAGGVYIQEYDKYLPLRLHL